MVRPGGCLYQSRVGPLNWTFARQSMPNLPLDPDVADSAPSDSVLTLYDEEHIITYLRACSTRTRKVPTGVKLHE
jgi:hypothetical protein